MHAVLTNKLRFLSWEWKNTSTGYLHNFVKGLLIDGFFCSRVQVTSVNRIPKPKPKVEKTAKVETENVADDANATDSASEEATTSKDQTTGESDDAANDKADAESSGHDEL